MEESIKCCICTERKKNVMFLCDHGTCQYCGGDMVTCHICQKEITKKIQTLSLCRSYVAYVLLMTVLATLMIRLCLDVLALFYSPTF